MIIRNVNRIEEKYLNLLKLIDSGEYKIASSGTNFEGVSRWVKNYTFESNDNIGILTSMIYHDHLRFQIAFKNDIDDKLIEKVYKMIQTIIEDEEKHAAIWLYTVNHQLLESLMNKYHLEKNQVYMSREMMYFKEPLNITCSPLTTISYQKDILMDTLNLLEASFVDIAKPNEFLNNADYYHQKFSNLNKSRFTGFILNDELIGMYFHHDGDLEYIGVKPKYQSKGFGKIILHHALQAIKEDSENIPYLYCVDENEKALAFYLREGFEVMGHAARLIVKNK